MVSSQQVVPDMTSLKCLAKGLQDKLGLNLIGVDVIIENNTGRYAVIDINAFPGKNCTSI
jgi:inositol-1,3,4-trisphosphate 5/6-kinase/inositol-tetrakisphosphate 1-kinase